MSQATAVQLWLAADPVPFAGTALGASFKGNILQLRLRSMKALGR